MTDQQNGRLEKISLLRSLAPGNLGQLVEKGPATLSDTRQMKNLFLLIPFCGSTFYSPVLKKHTLLEERSTC